MGEITGSCALPERMEDEQINKRSLLLLSVDVQLLFENFFELLLIDSAVFIFIKHFDKILSFGKVARFPAHLGVGFVEEFLDLFDI